MAVSKKKQREKLKEKYYKIISDFLSENGEEILQVKSNEFCFPVVDDEGDEHYVKISVVVPIGANYGKEPYDGHGAALSYQVDLKVKAEKEKEKIKKKAEKIKRDEEYRKKKEEQRKARENQEKS